MTAFDIIEYDGKEPITKPGVYRMTAEQYHADPCATPSLSSSIAKLVVMKTPRHAASEHPRLPAPKKREKQAKAMELGSVAHEMILGRGAGIVVIEADAYTTKAAKEARDAAIAAGKVPVLLEMFNAADVMAESVREILDERDDTSGIFKDGKGAAELVVIWQEERGLMCRAMLDWWSIDMTSIDDLKTSSVSISPADVGKQISNMNYQISEAFYTRGICTLFPELAGRLKFRFIFAETDAPYEVTVIENDATGREIGRRQVEYAIKVFGECMASGKWPGYPRGIHTATFPIWAEKAWMEREMNDPAFS